LLEKKYFLLSQSVKQITAVIFALVCLFFASKLLLIGTGFYPQPSLREILLLAGLVLLFNASKKIFYFILFPIIILHALYAPIGITFGPPSYQYIASVFATDLEESKELFAQLSWLNCTYPIVIIGLFILFAISANKASCLFTKIRPCLPYLLCFSYGIRHH